MTGRRRGVYWYVLQTHTAAEVAFKRYYHLTRSSGLLKHKPNLSDNYFTLVNDATVFFKSGANFEDLRAETLDGTIIDEMRQQHKNLWTRVIRPMLSRRKGWADIYSTPNGFDHFYDLFESAKDSVEWGAFHAPSTEAWWWSPEEVLSAKHDMSEAEFAQEIMAEFRDMVSGRAYVSFGDHNITRLNPFRVDLSPDPHHVLPIIVAMDFNLSPMAWTLGQNRVDDFYWFGEIFLRGSHTQEAARELVSRVKDHKAGVILIGDATGKASQRAAAGKSDYDIVKMALTEAKIPFTDRTPDSNPLIKDRVNAMNRSMKDAAGGVHFFVNPEGCPYLVKDCQRVLWKEGATATLDPGPEKMLTHASDGAGYAVHAFSPIIVSGSVGTVRVIRRV